MTSSLTPSPSSDLSTDEEAPAITYVAGKSGGHLIRAELLKIFSTNSWWIFSIFMLAGTGLALLINVFQANGDIANAEFIKLNPPNLNAGPVGTQPDASRAAAILAEYAADSDVGRVVNAAAASVYTSGQLLNLMFIVVLGALIVTNEFFHQTATATFLTTPARTRVIVSKLWAGVILATMFWAGSTAINIGIGAIDFSSNGYGVPFGDWVIIRAVLMNLLAYVVWALLGVGLGVLIQSQLGATITGAAMYWVSWPVAGVLFGLIRQYVIKEDWVWSFVVVLPGVASYLMVAAERVQFSFNTYSPPWWVGALVLVGYGLVASVVGTLITRKRDIS